MGLFGKKEDKQQAQQREIEAYLEAYGLNELDEKDLDILKGISANLAGMGLMRTGIALSFGKADEQVKIAYLSVLIEQIWLILKQLDRLNKKLENIK